MKDYSIDSEESKMFILNYGIKNENIIVKRAEGENFIIPYSTENENKIIERMKEQINDTAAFEGLQKDEINKKSVWFFISAVILMGGGFSFFTPGAEVLNWIMTVVGFLGMTYSAIDIAQRKIKLKDLKKFQLFLANQELINERINNNENMLVGVREKTKELVRRKNDIGVKETLKLKDIDNVTYDDIEKILDNISADEEFDFNYYKETKPKRRTRVK